MEDEPLYIEPIEKFRAWVILALVIGGFLAII